MEATGRVLHEAWWYDVLAWFWTGGKERVFRERIVSIASLSPGSRVLDVGCGTGTLAIAVKKYMGTGDVTGIDASSEMIDRARSKARRSGMSVIFESAPAQALPFADAQFDVVFSTLMLHHLPLKARLQCLAEIRRVLRPGGRIVIVDFETSGKPPSGLLRHFHRRRHGFVAQASITALLADAGLRAVSTGLVGFGDVHYTIATNGCP